MKIKIALSVATILAMGVYLNANETTKLDAITVKEAQTNPKNSYTIKETSSSTKLDLSLKETPQSISVITQQQIEDQNLQDINDILLQTPGVSVTQMGQKTSGFAWYYARGMRISNIQLDGVPTTSRASGMAELMGLESSALYERVEVTRGSTGLTNGSGNPSASINYVRKKPTKDFQGNAKISYGSWDTYKGQLDISGGLNEDKSIRGKLVASYADGDNQQDRYHSKNSLVYGALDFDLSDNTLLTTSIAYQKVKANDVSVHHFRQEFKDTSKTLKQDQNIFGRKDNPAADWAYMDSEKTNFSLGLEHYFNNDWKAVANYSYSKTDVERLIGLSRTVLNPTTGKIEGMAMASKNTPDVNSIDLYASGNIKAFNREHKLSFGINGYSLKSDDPSLTVNFPSTGNANITVPYQGWNGKVEKPIVKENGRNKVDEKEIGAFAALNIELSDPLHFIIGARVTNFERVNNKGKVDKNGKSTEKTQKHTGEFIPYTGLVYDINQNFTTYASYTSIFNPTSVRKDSSGNYLDPEEGNTVEFGLKSEFFDGKLNSSIAYFITKQDNLAVKTDPLEFTPEGDDAYKTVNGAKIKGWDLTIGGEILPNWNISGGYSYTSPKDKDGKRLDAAYVPKQTFKIFTNYKYNKLTLGGGINWQSEIYRNAEYRSGTISQKAYAVVNAMAKYEVNKGFDVILNANNIFDKEYKYFPSEGGYGDERNYTLSLNYKF
ncbi:TonB-dependent siderophore receptor [Aliarcobacter lanthieri]|uniref:TonB-dependent siderophore receptor n=1 Tax=Aliarcobacter lanthieri TaxID=1355374 RepID=UPI000690B03A|nr:TonB-dependent siderophore receptor [Aliarcobacter lanthieri]QKF60012.1 TonB-dependent ferric coprogen/ferric-rhodotorulic acid receptor [Aliarcobacter lanthieri]